MHYSQLRSASFGRKDLTYFNFNRIEIFIRSSNRGEFTHSPITVHESLANKHGRFSLFCLFRPCLLLETSRSAMYISYRLSVIMLIPLFSHVIHLILLSKHFLFRKIAILICGRASFPVSFNSNMCCTIALFIRDTIPFSDTLRTYL